MQPVSKKVLQSLFEQKIDGTLCDVEIHIQGSIIWGHACVLASSSLYFELYFKHEDQKAKHWCTRDPLTIVLDKELGDRAKICYICVSKIIDFVYLRELIVPKGHFQHFCKIVQLLRVEGLVQFCEKYLNEKISLDLLSTEKKEAKEKNFISTKCKPNSVCDNRCTGVQEPSNIKLKKNSPRKQSSDITDLCSRQQQNNVCVKPFVQLESRNIRTTKYESIVSSSSFSPDVLVPLNDLGSGIDASSAPKCEFVCCNPGFKLNNPPNSKTTQPKKRSMNCERCQFTSVSVKKMIKHIQTADHFVQTCPVCLLNKSIFNDLQQHLKDHNDPNPFICHICQKRNKFWERHKLHLRVHCRNKKYYCKICQRRFQHKANLTNHLMTHNYKYVCDNCGHLSSDLDNFKSHQLQHCCKTVSCNRVLKPPKENNIKSINFTEKKFEKIKKFPCDICNKGFTRKKNLNRHVQFQHLSNKNYKCSSCPYSTKRYDVLRKHWKRLHSCLPSVSEETPWTARKMESNIKQNEEKQSNEIVGVLIPVQLRPSNRSNSVIKGYALHASNNQPLDTKFVNSGKEEVEKSNSQGNDVFNELSNTEEIRLKETKSKLNIPNSNNEYKTEHIQEDTICSNVNDSFKSQFKSSMNNTFNQIKSQQFPCTLDSNNTLIYPEQLESFPPDMYRGGNNWENKTSEYGSQFSESHGEIWLNEATGELLNGQNHTSLTKIDSDIKTESNLCVNKANSKLSLAFEESLESLLKSATDLDDDDINSNPRTPQTNLVDFDCHENLFPWEGLHDNICSTWVLNETTGELNMVSFGIKPLKNSDDLKLDENTGTFSSLDDDETALFLNEGTGDLSVIYFNPNKNYCDTTNYFQSEQINQENLETISQHSNDDDDLLNEDFLLASADFMSRDENESFLNELTGEFCKANYNFQTDSCQTISSQTTYLNEETGEIQQNYVHESTNNLLVPEDFEQFSSEMSKFSSQFCLDDCN